jgi:hypothetical protein
MAAIWVEIVFKKFYKETLSLGGFYAQAPTLARREFFPVGLKTRLKTAHECCEFFSFFALTLAPLLPSSSGSDADSVNASWRSWGTSEDCRAQAESALLRSI